MTRRLPADDTTRTRFVPGDYYQPGDYFENVLRRNATAYFLAALAHHHKPVLQSLKKLVLPAYRAAIEELRAANQSQEAEDLSLTWVDARVCDRPKRLEEILKTSHRLASLHHLKESLDEWGNRFGLNLHRILDAALASVAAWYADPRRPLKWNHLKATQPEAMVPTTTVPFQVNAWSPRAEPKIAARRRMTASLLQQLETYLDSVEMCRRGEGWKQVPTKDEVEDHFRLLAMYQVDQLTISEIARKVARAEDAEKERKRIAAAIDSAGELIAGNDWFWWKRKASKGGRPKKSR
jgi:hypothetical protein